MKNVEISDGLKCEGWTYRDPDKNHPKYKIAEEICKNTIILDLSNKEDEKA